MLSSDKYHVFPGILQNMCKGLFAVYIQGAEVMICVAVSFLIFTAAGCGNSNKPENIDFKDTVIQPETKKDGKNSISICIGAMITPEEGYAYYKALLDYIGENLYIEVNFVEKVSYQEVNTLLEQDKIDAAFVCGGPYVEGKSKFGLELLVAPQVDGRTIYYSYIIVQKESKIDSFTGLKGKSFALVDPMSNSGKKYPDYLLKQIGESENTFFSEHPYSGAHDTSIKAVAEGIVEGAAVDSIIWNYMSANKSSYVHKTKIINKSPPFGIPPVVVRPDLNKELKEKLRSTLLDMHKVSKGKRILENMRIDKFVIVEDSNYDSIRKLDKETADR